MTNPFDAISSDASGITVNLNVDSTLLTTTVSA